MAGRSCVPRVIEDGCWILLNADTIDAEDETTALITRNSSDTYTYLSLS